MDRLFVVAGALNGFFAVVMGAFGAHALRGETPDTLLRAFETSAQYQGIHALAFIAVGILLNFRESRCLVAAGWALLAGVLLFCGSLYGMALSGTRALGAITPLGGIGFLAGWLLFAMGAWRGTARSTR